MKTALAFDFGASGGRAVLGQFDGEKTVFHEVHRFSNDPVMVNGVLHWDVLRLLYEIEQGILKAKADGGFDSIGIDTWGVDFGLIDAQGNLLSNPVHYRDVHYQGAVERAAKKISKDEMYKITGIQFMDFNTAFQLFEMGERKDGSFSRAETLLLMPDLLNYFLTGKVAAEYSIATTTQLVDLKSRDWSKRMTDALGIPHHILPKIIRPGQILGNLHSEIAERLGVPAVPVVAVCGHDTQSAITAVPAEEEDFAFISSGTWSLFGTETKAPIVTKEAEQLNVTNEGGYDFSTAFLKNICGLWLIQESRRQYAREGKNYSYAELEKLACEAEPFACFIDPDDPVFSTVGDIPNRIRDFCKKTGQKVPESTGEVLRCIYESLALKYRVVLDGISRCTGKEYKKIYVVGGGTKDTFLLRLSANSCGVEVQAGPAEATVLGNLSVQLIALGELDSVAGARKAVAAGTEMKIYSPENQEEWEKALYRFRKILHLD